MKRVLESKKNISLRSLIQLPRVKVKGISMNEDQLFISAEIASKYGFCPLCGSRSKRLHSYYCRKLQDLPIISRSVKLELKVRKIFCDNPKCSKKVFSQQLSDKVVPYSRRTSRANDRLLHLSKETSSNKASWISEQMLLRVSSSTCLRTIHKCNVSPPAKMTHLGIDDWAYHKGHTYGTIVVNRETGKTVEVLKSREKEDIAEWLRQYPDIKTITRDRGDCYIQAVSEALPDAIQIADRFHLIVNYSDHVRNTVKKLISRLKIGIALKKTGIQDNDDIIIQKIIDLSAASAVQPDENKSSLIRRVRDLYKENYSMRSIAQILQIDFRTVHKYIHMEKDQILTIRKTFVNYTMYLDDLIDGFRKGESISLIFRRIKEKGFKGSLRGLTIRFGKLYKGRMERRGSSVSKKETIKFPKIFSSRKISIYLTNKNFERILSPVEIGWYEHLRKENPILQSLWNLSENFRSIFTERSIMKFHEWIQQVRQSDFRELKNFVCGLQKDLKAIEASIIYDFNNGITEGCVNRLKNIKKQMYGRASFDLLRKKVILSKWG
jgi:transposase